MNSFSKKRIFDTMYLSITICSFVLVLLYLISFVFVKYNVDEHSKSLVWCLCGYFIALLITENSKKSFLVSLSSLLIEIIYNSITNNSIGVGLIFVIFLFISYVSTKFDLLYSFIISVMLAIVIGLLFGAIYNFHIYLIKLVASAISNKPILFTIINQPLSLLFGKDFSNTLLKNDYTGAVVINKKLVVGALNIFNFTKDNPLKEVGNYLTSNYYSNIFLPIGTSLSLYKRMKGDYRVSLIVSALLSVLCGNNVLFSLFILFYNPFIYIAYVLISGLSNLICRLVDIRIGFVDDASLVELICYLQKPVYFILIGLILIALMYFSCKYIMNKYDFKDMRYIPKNIRQILKALGGEENIQTIKNGVVYVYNPNLIDVLKLDCEIHNNQIKLLPEDFEELIKYK